MLIAGMQKLTLLDYPNELACIIFTGGCNFKCPFCQNSSLIKYKEDETTISEEYVISYLEKRKNVLDGVVISGGEPTIHKELEEFIVKIKNLGYKVKLDTNGYNPVMLESLIIKGLIDYVAMDIKNSIDNYSKIVGLKTIKTDNILKSIKILKNSNIDYEFRTTIMKEYHSIENIKKIIKLIGKDSKYYLQNFRDSDGVLDKTLHGFSEEELKRIKELLNYENLNIR